MQIKVVYGNVELGTVNNAEELEVAGELFAGYFLQAEAF